MAISEWDNNGYTNQFTGDMYDMRNPWPKWFDMTLYNNIFNWKQLSWSFYKMKTGTILPEHIDTYSRFKQLNTHYKDYNVRRAIVFLEDWKPGHVLTLGNSQLSTWRKGDYVWWEEDVPHLAANIGINDRYTLQLTGFVKDD